MLDSSPNTFSGPIDFRLPKQPPTVDSWSSLNNLLRSLYNSLQQIIHALFYHAGLGNIGQQEWPLYANIPAYLLNAGNLNKLYAVAYENIAAGDQVSIVNVMGSIQVKRAIAGTGAKVRADGFAYLDIVAGQAGLVILNSGINPSLVNLIPGQRYWLSTTVPGGLQTVAPSAAGTIEQYIGIAVDSSNLFQTISYPVQH